MKNLTMLVKYFLTYITLHCILHGELLIHMEDWYRMLLQFTGGMPGDCQGVSTISWCWPWCTVWSPRGRSRPRCGGWTSRPCWPCRGQPPPSPGASPPPSCPPEPRSAAGCCPPHWSDSRRSPLRGGSTSPQPHWCPSSSGRCQILIVRSG